MKRAVVDSNKPIARVIVTPIIDVALVLVIILLITAPILSVADLEVRLPEAETRGAEDEVRLSITLSKTGELALDEDIVAPGELRGVLGARLAKAKNTLVVVRADAEVPYRAVRRVLRDAKAAGAARLAIATRQSGKGE